MLNRIKNIILFSLLLFVGSSFSVAQNSTYQYVAIAPELKENANTVVRLSDLQIDIESQRLMKVKYRRIVTVLNNFGNNNVRAYLHYDDNTKVKSVKATVYDGLGNPVKTVKEKHFKDVSAVDGGTLYSDSRVLYLKYTPVSYPYTVEYEYEIETSNTAFIPPWRPFEGYGVSTELNTISITDHASLGLRMKEKNLMRFSGIENHSSGKTVGYTAKKLKAIEHEDYSPSLRSYMPNVLFAISSFHLEGVDGYANDWKEMGKWQHDNLLMGKDNLPAATIEKIKAMTAHIDHPLEKAKVVYKYVQDNTRYISVQVGIGGWMPIEAKEVDQVKYGDCKALTNYTKALLKAAGVESYYTVVHSGLENIGMEENFASMQGNHVILNIPLEKGEAWLECTSQIIPFGFLGSFTDDRKVLVVTPEGGVLKKTSAYSVEENYQKINSEYSLNQSGEIKGNVSIVTKGIQYYQRFSIEDFSKEDMEKHYKKYWRNVNNLTIHSFSHHNEKDKVTFNEKVHLAASKYASIAGDRIIFAPNAFNKYTRLPKNHRNRKMPLEISRGFFDEDEFKIHLPEGFKVEALAESKSIETSFGSYKVDIVKNDDATITYRRSLVIQKGEFSKEKYHEFREFLKKVNKYDNAKIVLIKS